MSDSDHVPERASDILRDVSAKDVPVILFPAPIVHLLFCGAWSRLLLLVRWHAALQLHTSRKGRRSPGPIHGWPPEDAVVWANVGRYANRDSGPLDALTHTMLSDMSNSVRQWARSLRTEALRPCATNPCIVFLWFNFKSEFNRDWLGRARFREIWAQTFDGPPIPNRSSRFRRAPSLLPVGLCRMRTRLREHERSVFVR
jgi:hypothetical protein